MTKATILKKNLLISGIMCSSGCGDSIRSILDEVFKKYKEQGSLPQDAQLCIYAEPDILGIHRLVVKIKSNDKKPENLEDAFFNEFQQRLEEGGVLKVINNLNHNETEVPKEINWINISINVFAIGVISVLWFVFPPSLLLTVGLTLLSSLATAFTTREYLINFFRNLENKNFFNMTSTISLGWFLSLAHTLYHSIVMPLASSFSMAFMSFIMPITLITLINSIDEIKRVVFNRSQKMYLKGVKALFPQMETSYECYQLSSATQEKIDQLLQEGTTTEFFIDSTQNLLNAEKIISVNIDELAAGMCIEVKRGECFPVDCVLIRGNTLIDAAILSGESQINKTVLDSIPAGAINLGQKVTVYAKKDAYSSTINQILFRANRALENPTAQSIPKFTYLYSLLIIVGMAISIVLPLTLGVFTISLLLQNLISILFIVCPCTIAIAHQLPTLLSIYHHGTKGILLRNETITHRSAKIHTIVFDKTGTLTTGNSIVKSFSSGIDGALWERIYLLEKAHGGAHPIAKAIVNYWQNQPASLFKEIKDEILDPKNRGLSATVQGIKIHIGNAEYFAQENIIIPEIEIPPGISPIYVAENNAYKGVIFIQHEPRMGISEALKRLKKENIAIVMLTGDSKLSANGFNHQIGSVFEEKHIHYAQTPQDKENFLNHLMMKTEFPEGVWFMGDGLNDGPCARIVSEKGGVSCAITSDDKAAFFTDISLDGNGSLDYVFNHLKLNQFLQKNITQNQWILAHSSLVFLAFTICFSVAGIAVSPLIPLSIMLGTTFFILFNSYRIRLKIDDVLDKSRSWLRQLLASDLSISLLVGASCFLILDVLISTISTGGLALPAIVFTAGPALAVASSFLIAAIILFTLFTLLVTSYFLSNNINNQNKNTNLSSPPPETIPLHARVAENFTSKFTLYQGVKLSPNSEKTNSAPEEGKGGFMSKHPFCESFL